MHMPGDVQGVSMTWLELLAIACQLLYGGDLLPYIVCRQIACCHAVARVPASTM